MPAMQYTLFCWFWLKLKYDTLENTRKHFIFSKYLQNWKIQYKVFSKNIQFIVADLLSLYFYGNIEKLAFLVKFILFLLKICLGQKTTFYLVCNFEENRSKIATMRVLERKSAKWPPWRHRFRNVKIREKWTSKLSVRSFVENFIKIDPFVWAAAL